jgi:putative two-component system response regulator
MNREFPDRGEGHVLIVDDEKSALAMLAELMTRRGYQATCAANGVEALACIAQAPPDVVLMDVNMPQLDGFETCRRIKGNPATTLIPVVLVTGLNDTADRVRGIEAGADDFLSKPFVMSELVARVRSLVRLKRYTDELESAKLVIRSLALTIESRDPYTAGHCERLAKYATAFGEALALDKTTLEALHLGGFLHDVGKVGIPDAILLKPSALSAEERRVMEGHTVIGETIIGELRSLDRVRGIVRHHHERLDGSGYPDRLAGDAIPLEAQILSIVDAFDAMTTDRPYKPKKTPAQACDELAAEAARGWKSAALVECFIRLIATRAFEGDGTHAA